MFDLWGRYFLSQFLKEAHKDSNTMIDRFVSPIVFTVSKYFENILLNLYMFMFHFQSQSTFIITIHSIVFSLQYL